jgi:hypothetical protein
VPNAKAQKNFTDPQSRIMKSKDGFVEPYNAQAAVDAEALIIAAQDVTQSAIDCGQLRRHGEACAGAPSFDAGTSGHTLDRSRESDSSPIPADARLLHSLPSVPTSQYLTDAVCPAHP